MKRNLDLHQKARYANVIVQTHVAFNCAPTQFWRMLNCLDPSPGKALPLLRAISRTGVTSANKL
jgi:hypothetical protein